MARSTTGFPGLDDLNPHRHRLSDDENEAIFQSEIVPNELEPAPRDRGQPIAYLLGGQPAAGKSFCKRLIRRSLPADSSPADIGSDLFRVYHPEYERLQEADDRTAAFYTDYDARLWVDKAVRFSVERRANILLDSTLSRPEKARELLNELAEHGYVTDVVFIATPQGLSRLSNIVRYLEMCEATGGHGRICIPEDHDRAYTGVVKTAEVIDIEIAADSVFVRRRDGRIPYENRRTDQPYRGWMDPDRTAAPVIVEERNYATEAESHWFDAQLGRLQYHPRAGEWQYELTCIEDMFRPLPIWP